MVDEIVDEGVIMIAKILKYQKYSNRKTIMTVKFTNYTLNEGNMIFNHRASSKSVISVFPYTYNINNTRVYYHHRISLLLPGKMDHGVLGFFRNSSFPFISLISIYAYAI